MTLASATAYLVQSASRLVFGSVFSVVDRLEALAERRASRRALHGMSDVALADIGLTEADLSRPDPTCSWKSLVSPPPA
jgi:uncharacterized protein YjiS (DUF1127 family)